MSFIGYFWINNFFFPRVCCLQDAPFQLQLSREADNRENLKKKKKENIPQKNKKKSSTDV